MVKIGIYFFYEVILMERKYSVGWGLTNICNMNCKFCYSKETRIKSNNTTLEDWIKFVDDNYQYIDSINYGTGENTLCDDFFLLLLMLEKNIHKLNNH
jgi:MoaA/NifB/PqqE/SkfB family radical SAM enzyme